MKRVRLFVACAAAAIGVLASTAAADTVGPIDFENYTLGDINGQQGWQKLNPSFDVAVAPGFGGKALRLSDAYTSGSFGDQTFSPGLSAPAGEAGLYHFEASFEIGTTSATEQPGLHMSVSPDDGTGSRMSYLNFVDQPGGVDVYFDDATDPGPLGRTADFSNTRIATLDRSSAYTIGFSIDFNPGPANDVVNISIDGKVVHTGTTWEDYYRYDPEQAGNGNTVPVVRKLLFREAGIADPANAGGGFLVDNISLSSSACGPTGLYRDGINLTAARIDGDVTGSLDATGCDIGVYYGPGTTGSVNGATITGANYYGVVADGAAVDVTGSDIDRIGESPLNGSQHGVGVLFSDATGTLSGTTIANYQKNGVVVTGTDAFVNVLANTVTGQGPIDYIAQNGIEIASGASAVVKDNSVSGNWYTPKDFVACGLLFVDADGVKQSGNTLTANEINVCNAGRGGGNPTA